MSATSDTGSESRKFYARVSVMISEKKKRKLCAYCLLDKKKVLHWQILFVHVYVVVDLLIALRTPTQRICCYYCEFHILDTLHVTTALNVIYRCQKHKIEL